MDSSARALPLASLVAALAGARANVDAGVVVRGIAHDSRDVRPGTIFVALRGEGVDGHRFVAAAIEAGACAVVVEAAFAATAVLPADAVAIVVPDTYRALSQLSAAFYGEPSRKLRIAGVTGTNGKTTTTHLIAAILEEADIRAGRIGTLGARFGGAMWSLGNTTPFADELQGLLAEMRDRGAQDVAMEVSSHALAQDRVADVNFAIAVLTNVTRDHLDFHGDFETYAAAKRSLFERAPLAVLNYDDARGRGWTRELAAAGRTPLTYGFGAGATLVAADVEMRADGSEFVANGRRFTTRLPGRFNVHNALAALAVAGAYGIDDAVSARALAAFERVPGRMEHLAGGGIDVLVDYAHTPDALEVVLRAARETTRGALAVVFGCGGDRDRGKRPQMGRIACELADRVIVTSDNPRGEEPQAIVAQILAGIPDRRKVTALVERRAAIRHAIEESLPGDVVVVAGKGHETYQIIGTVVNHFDDRHEVRAALATRASVR